MGSPWGYAGDEIRAIEWRKNHSTDVDRVGESRRGHEASKVEKSEGVSEGHRVVREIEESRTPRVEGSPWGNETYGVPPNGNRVPNEYGRG